MTTPTSLFPSLTGMLKVHRGVLIAVSIIGIVLGVLALVWPGASLIYVGLLFGSYLLASGIFRIIAAFAGDHLTTGQRWVSGIFGLIVLLAGFLALTNIFTSLLALALLIAIGWIAEGIIDIAATVRGAVRPTWLGWVSGILSVVAGIVTLFLPAVALNVFITVGAFLLIFVSVSTLLTLPRATKPGAQQTV